MWEQLTPSQLNERKANLRQERAKIAERIKVIDADIARLETLERDITELFGNQERDHPGLVDPDVPIESPYLFGTDAVLGIVKKHSGIWRSDIIKYLREDYRMNLSKNTVSTYLNRFSHEGKVVCIGGKWYGAEDE